MQSLRARNTRANSLTAEARSDAELRRGIQMIEFLCGPLRSLRHCGGELAVSLTLLAASTAHAAPNSALAAIGRAPTPAEVRAWDIDVRADFQGLPRGAGSVALGETVWQAKCAGCHGAFGESNDVFTPLVGGTTQADIASGRVANLAQPGFPHRTTLMKVSKVSALWDYIRRAMPWTAPKSLTPDEVYAVLAYLLHLGEIVPADFVLSDQNIAQVQQRLPNRHGKVFDADLWRVDGRGDVHNTACMQDCPVERSVPLDLPQASRGAHGNIAQQMRPFGPARGTDTAPAPPPRPQARRDEARSKAIAQSTTAGAN